MFTVEKIFNTNLSLKTNDINRWFKWSQ